MVWGILFLFVYSLTAVFAAGGGHGTYIFFAPLMPYGFGAILLLGSFYLIKYIETRWIRLLFVAFLLTDYFATLMFVISWWPDDYPYLKKTWFTSPIHVVLPLLFFIIGNSFLWYTFASSMGNSETSQFGKGESGLGM